MKLHELRESRYLTKEDVDPPLNVTIKKVIKENVGMEGEESREKFVMFFEGQKKGMVLNFTNGTILEEITKSDDSEGWVGWKIQLYSEPNIFFGGKKTGGIRIRPTTDHAPDLREKMDMEEAQRELDEAADRRRRRRTEVEEEESEIPF